MSKKASKKVVSLKKEIKARKAKVAKQTSKIKKLKKKLKKAAQLLAYNKGGVFTPPFLMTLLYQPFPSLRILPISFISINKPRI